jgi:hypothetical protein
MIAGCDYFYELAKILKGDLFVILTVYADESKRGEIVDICGFIESPEYWTSFSKRWSDILKGYTADYFHFREYATPKLYTKPGRAYFGWSDKKRDSFLYELAILAGESAVPVGSYSVTSKGNSLKGVMGMFYYGVFKHIDVHWPNFNGKVVFIYDQNEDVEMWSGPLTDVHRQAQQAEHRIGAIAFEDDKILKPLQAADMLAYAPRQNTERFWEGNNEKQPLRLLDYILTFNLSASNRKTSKEHPWLLKTIVDHYKKQTAIWKRNGIKEKYYPMKHFPFGEYGVEFKQ